MWGAFWEGRSLNVGSFLGGKESSCGELSGREEGVFMWGAFWEGRSLNVRAFWEGRSLNVGSFLGGKES